MVLEEKILRTVSIFVALFCIVLAACSDKIFNGLNQWQADIELARVEYRLRQERQENLLGMSGIDYLKSVTASLLSKKSEEVVEELLPEEEVVTQIQALPFDSQLRLELPEGISISDLAITGDYMNKIISYRVPGFNGDYLIDYPMIGDADHINEITYFADDRSLLVEFRMDGIYEPEYTTDGHYVFLDFVTPKEKYDYVVVVDAGHGGDMPGAIKSGIQEKNITLAVVTELKKIFEKESKKAKDSDPKIGVYYTRTTDCNPDFADRIGIANEIDADFFVSVHINSLNNASANGTLVMYNQKAKKKKRLSGNQAQIMLDTLVEELGSNSRGLTDGSDIYVLHHAQVPAVLAELGFISNQKERALLVTEDYQKKCARALYDAIKVILLGEN